MYLEPHDVWAADHKDRVPVFGITSFDHKPNKKNKDVSFDSSRNYTKEKLLW